MADNRENRRPKGERHIALLGSTGSIGRNTLDVIAAHSNHFKLIGLAAGKNIDLLERQIDRFQPKIICVKERGDGERIRRRFPDVRVTHGGDGLEDMISFPGVDTVVAAIDGTSSLQAILSAIDHKHRICLANKESLVAAGALINNALDRSRAELLPIDSEQSAIFQSLGANHRKSLRRVILTASGGPFFGDNDRDFSAITPEEALAHPTWSMGKKITIDSATLMNKALEIIEAFYLFRLAADQIDLLIHPQSIVHSMVEFLDLSMIAQLSVPDMKIPILYSLSYPNRLDSVSQALDLGTLRKLEFFNVDPERFPSIRMARFVLTEGKNSGAVLNAANEIAVEQFLKKRITFADIFSVVEAVLDTADYFPITTVEEVDATIEITRAKTMEIIKRRTDP